MMNRVLPHDLNAERSVLGAILLDCSCVPTVAGIVEPDDFYLEANKTIFKAVCNMHGRGEPIDVVSLPDALKSGGELENAGGVAYISSLADRMPSAANVDYWARIVKEKSELRKIIYLSSVAMQEAYDGGDVEAIRSELIDGVSAGRGGDIEPVSFAEAREQLKKIQLGEGLDIGLPGLTRYIRIYPGDMTIIGGDSSQGKSALALQMAVHLGKSMRVLFISVEMTTHVMTARILASRTGWAINTILSGQYFETTPVNIPGLYFLDSIDKPTEIEAVIHRFKPDVVFIDYLQKLNYSERAREKLYQAMSNFACSTQRVCRKMGAYYFLVSQLTLEKNRLNMKPTFHDIRESQSLKNDADIVLLLWRPWRYEVCRKEAQTNDWKEDTCYVIIGKNRNGPCRTLQMRFNGVRQQFSAEGEDSGDSGEAGGPAGEGD